MANEATVPEPATAEPAAAANPPARRNLRRLRGFLLIAVLTIIAAAASSQFRPHSDHEETPPESTPAAPKDPPRAKAIANDPAEILTRGDNALLEHRYPESLALYQDLVKKGRDALPGLGYRMGLCHESMGQFADAQASYRQAIARSSSRSLEFACHLGIARCLLSVRQPLEARRLLYPFLFDEQRHEDVPPIFAADAHFLIGLSLACMERGEAKRPKSEDEPVSFLAIPLEVPFYLDEVAVQIKRRPVAALPQIPIPLAIKQQTENERTIVLCAERRGQPAWDLLEQLAVGGKLKTAWTANAKKALADRALDLHLHNWNLNDVLEDVSDYLDLACQIEGNEVRFSTRTEVDAESAVALQRAMALRSLSAAVRVDVGGPFVPAAFLALGNVEATRGRRREAAFWYNRLTREIAYSNLALFGHFNLAGLYRSASDIPLARKAYFRVVDHSPGHDLAMRAYLEIGRSYLYDEDTKAGIVHLRRAQALAAHSTQFPYITLTLAAAYLQSGDLASARQVLTRARTPLQRAPFKAAATFLDALAQYRLAKATKDSKPGRREASELIGILGEEKDETVLGPYGQWLLAQAYRDTGFLDQAERTLRKCVAAEKGPFKACLEYTLAEVLASKGQRLEAAKIFARHTREASPYHGRSCFQLARIDLDEKRYQECAERCKKLWAEHGFSDRPALLALWGSALEACGELEKASKCFAGKAPD